MTLDPQFAELNLPAAQFILKTVDGKVYVWDIIRKKQIFLTPEEWVRQHMIHYLIDYLNYPKGLIQVEKQVKLLQFAKRADIVVYDKIGDPKVLIECKQVKEKITQAVVNQAGRYNMQLSVPYLMVTNGLQHFIYHIKSDKKTIKPLKYLPLFDDLA